MHPRLLILEDDPDILCLLGELFRLEGFEVATATNGREGLLLLEQMRPDLILLDLDMPVMNGFQFRKQQLADAESAEIPTIVFSGVIAERSDSATALLKAADVIAKPFDLERLVEVVKSHYQGPEF